MERKLSRLFDYQKFEGNDDLQQIIDAVHDRRRFRTLTLEEMEMVNAAGEPMPVEMPLLPDERRTGPGQKLVSLLKEMDEKEKEAERVVEELDERLKELMKNH